MNGLPVDDKFEPPIFSKYKNTASVVSAALGIGGAIPASGMAAVAPVVAGLGGAIVSLGIAVTEFQIARYEEDGRKLLDSSSTFAGDVASSILGLQGNAEHFIRQRLPGDRNHPLYRYQNGAINFLSEAGEEIAPLWNDSNFVSPDQMDICIGGIPTVDPFVTKIKEMHQRSKVSLFIFKRCSCCMNTR